MKVMKRQYKLPYVPVEKTKQVNTEQPKVQWQASLLFFFDLETH
jgi:hypothetical protein